MRFQATTLGSLIATACAGYGEVILYPQAVEDDTSATGGGAVWCVSVCDPVGAMTRAGTEAAVAFVGTGAFVQVFTP